MNDNRQNFLHGSVWRAASVKAKTKYALLEFNSLDRSQARLVPLAGSGAPAFFECGEPGSWWTASAMEEALCSDQWTFVHEEFTRAKLLAVDQELQELGQEYDSKVAYYRNQVKAEHEQSIQLLSLHMAAGQPLTLAAKHPVFVVLASHLARFFKEEGGPNYASVELTDPQSNVRYEVLVKPCHAKMPATLAAERLALLEKSQQRVAELEARLESMQDAAATGQLKSGSSKEVA